MVVPTNTFPKTSDARTASVSTDEIAAAHSAGTNYVWMGQTIIFSILTISGALVTKKQDKKDE